MVWRSASHTFEDRPSASYVKVVSWHRHRTLVSAAYAYGLLSGTPTALETPYWQAA